MISAYLGRLGLDRAEPSLDYLFALHRAQVERVPYENLEILLGRSTTVDPAESMGRIVTGRGGYCFHLNGALGALLTELGFRVRMHVGGVHSLGEAPVGATGNHMVLTVSGLPTAGHPDGVWFVDSGLGDAIHEPVPLRAGEFRQGPFAYRLDPSEVIEGGWHFSHAVGGSFGGMDFGLAAVPSTAAFAANHAELSAVPTGHFARLLVAQRRDADGVDMLRGLLLTRWDAEGKHAQEINGRARWRAAWADVFGVHLTEEEVGVLWPKAQRMHAEWLAGQVATV